MSLLLLDTHLLLWASAAERLPRVAYERIADPGNTLAFSVASLWEVVLEATRLKKELGLEPRQFRREWLDAGYREITVTGTTSSPRDDCRRSTRTRSTAC